MAPDLEPGLTATETKVLFIGNSLTYFNDMPEIFKNLALTSGNNVYVVQETIGGMD